MASKQKYESQDKFVNYELTKEERPRYKAWLPDLESYGEALFRLCDSGYRISVKWDHYSKSYAAFIMPNAKDDPNAGLILTGRGSVPHKAMKEAMYKHFVVFDCQWGSWAPQATAEEIDD